jgi:hypothetical protein
MNLKDITYLKSINPITVLKTPPSKKTTLFLAMIMQDEKLYSFIQAMRQQYNFPDQDITKFVGKDPEEISIISEIVLQPLQMFSDVLCATLGITADFKIQMILLIFFNAFIDLEYFEGFITKPIDFILGKKKIASALHDYSYEIGAIIVPFNTSQNKLTQWIKKNWSKIEKQMEDLPVGPYQLGEFKNIELSLEIIKLKDDEKLTFSEIASSLFKKYPDDGRVADESWVKKNYYVTKAMLSSPQQPKVK